MEPILQVLDAQWSKVAASPEARRALIRWSRQHEALAGMRDLRDVLESRLDPEQAGEVLHVLSLLAPVEELAARTLLQVLLPGLVRMVGTIDHDNPDAADELVALAWERIRTYPPTRGGSVAANVLLDVRKRYLSFHRRRPGDIHLAREQLTYVGPEEHVLAKMQLEEVLDAKRRGVVSAAVFDAIVRTRLDGESLADVAASQGIDTEVLCQRRWRAQQRLRSLPLAG